MESGPVIEPNGTKKFVVIKSTYTGERCALCDRPIAPGQLYLTGPVRHLGCRDDR